MILVSWKGDFQRHWEARVFGSASFYPSLNKGVIRVIDDSEKRRAISAGTRFFNHQDYAKYYRSELAREVGKKEPNSDLVKFYQHEAVVEGKFKPVFLPKYLVK